MTEARQSKGEISLVSNTENGFYELGERLLALGYIVTGFLLIDERFVIDQVDQERKLEKLGMEERQERVAKQLEIHRALNTVVMGKKVEFLKEVSKQPADVIVVMAGSLVTLVASDEIVPEHLFSSPKARPVIKYVEPGDEERKLTSLAFFRDNSKETGVGYREAEFFSLLQGFLAPTDKEEDKE